MVSIESRKTYLASGFLFFSDKCLNLMEHTFDLRLIDHPSQVKFCNAD